MEFLVEITMPGGGRRQARVLSDHDATHVLAGQIEREVLAEGESIATRPSPHAPRERREAYVPAIWRVA